MGTGCPLQEVGGARSRSGRMDMDVSQRCEPSPRFEHISCLVGSKVIVQGGRTEDFSPEIRQHLSSVVEIFDPYSELWEKKQVTGDAPLPGVYGAACASVHSNFFLFGGYNDERQYFNTLYRLDTDRMCWSRVSPQHADRAPIPKAGCGGMIKFGNSLGVFGGCGVSKERFLTENRDWTNELHFYSLSEGIIT